MGLSRLEPDPMVYRVWGVFALGVGALAGLALFLPLPWSAWGIQAGSPEALVTTVALGLCSATVWATLLWGALAALVTLGAQLPGRAGRRCRQVALAVAPGLARRAITTVVGVGVVGGVVSAATHGPTVHPGGDAVAQSAAGASAADDLAESRWAVGGVSPTTDQRPAGALLLRVGDGPDFTSMFDLTHGGGGGAVFASQAHLHPGETGAGRGDPTPAPTPSTDWPALDPDWPGSRTSTGTPTSAAPVSPASPDGEVVVLRGDSLWSIAAAHLPASATDADINTAWRAWYAANQTVIGADPDVILPGQRLVPPAVDVGAAAAPLAPAHPPAATAAGATTHQGDLS